MSWKGEEYAEGFDDFMDGKVAERSRLTGRAALPVTNTTARKNTAFELRPEISDESHLRDGSRVARPATSAAAPGAARPARQPMVPNTAPADPDGPAWGAHIVVDKKPYKIHTVTDFMGRATHTFNMDDGKRYEALRGPDGRFSMKSQQKK